jgi:hypothetical protein
VTNEKPSPAEYRRWMYRSSGAEMERVWRESLAKDCPDVWLAVIDMRDEGGRKLAAVAQWITQWDGVSPPPERADE